MSYFIKKTNLVNLKLSPKIILLSLSLLLFWSTSVEAQVPEKWSVPHRLSTEGFHASQAYMVEDQYGYLHTFWTEANPFDSRTTIQLARFDGEAWSTPVDIYVTRPGEPIQYLAPSIDPQGLIHLVWSQGFRTGPAYHMNAPAHDALSARNWTTPRRIDIPAFWIRLEIDSKGRLHILYSKFNSPQPGVYYVSSKDQGQTWSDPFWLDPDIPDNQAPNFLQFSLDKLDGLHTVWNYIDLSETIGQSVRYAHSLDGGESWSLPVTIDEPDEVEGEVRMAHPGMIVQNQTVHVIWAGTDQTNREHRFSTDAGQSWSVPLQVFGSLHGQAAGDGMAVDAAGRTHFASHVRHPSAIWHAYWDQDHWESPSIVHFEEPHSVDIGLAHHTRLAVRGGNQLVLTFTEGSGARSDLHLFASHRTLSDISTSLFMPTPTPIPTTTPTATPISSPTVNSPTPTPRITARESDTPPAAVGSPVSPLVLGIIPTLFFVGVVIVVQLVHKK